MCGNRWAWCGVLTAVLLTGLTCTRGFGEDKKPSASKPVEPEHIRQNDPTFLVRAEVNKPTRAYREGDTLSVTVASEADAYLYVLYKQADGKIFLIYPNSEQPDNRVKARQAVKIPASEDLFRWEVGPPFGKETIKVIASREPLRELSDSSLHAKFFNPITRQQVKGVQVQLGKQPAPWAEDYVEIVTRPANDELDRSGVRRWGVFIGISEYGLEDATKQKITMRSPPCHRDARRLAEVFREVGRLSDLQIRTNERATRKDLEEVITAWLPSVSRPGDTVLIYFSGVTAAISGESDPRPRVVLVPHDFVPPEALEGLVQQGKSEGLPRLLAEQVLQAIELVKRMGSVRAATPQIARMTGIGEDLFAHWLQALAGRQIVLIFDTGYAGVFAPGGAKGDASSQLESFGSQVTRLKDLGQQEIALLGASGPKEKAALRIEDELSLLTMCLIKILNQTPGSVTLEDAHKRSTAMLQDLVSEANRRRQAAGQEPLPVAKPYLINSCTRPVMLKP